MNFADHGYDVDEMQRFVVSVASQFYPDFGRLYRTRIDEWAKQRCNRSASGEEGADIGQG
jgi:hypothetical protein